MSLGVRTLEWDAFRASALFETASDQGVRRLIESAETRRYNRGDYLFFEGGAGESFALVIEGHLRSIHAHADGRQVILHFAWPGDTCGSLIEGESSVFPSDIEAAESSLAAIVPCRSLRHLLADEPSVASAVIKVQAQRIEMLANAIKVISADVPCRVAHYIVLRLDPRMRRLGKTHTIDLLVSRVELASALGTVPETLSRTFAQLVRDELIEADGHFVKILDLPRLMELAEFSGP